MIDTTEMTPQKLKDVKEYAAKLGLALEQTPWEIILWRQSSMEMFFKTCIWSEILEVLDFKCFKQPPNS